DYFRLITPDLQEEGIPSLSTPLGQELIEQKLGGAELVILDNVTTLFPGGKENEIESWRPAQSWILRLRRRGVAVLFAHHAGRNGQSRGTSGREDVLDTVIALRRPDDYRVEQGARFIVEYEKTRSIYGGDVEPFEAQMETHTGAAVWLTDKPKADLLARVLELREAHVSIRAIAAQLGIDKGKVERILNKRSGSS